MINLFHRGRLKNKIGMQNKFILLVVIVLALGGLLYFVSNNDRAKLKPLPTKDNPTLSGLYSNVPPFSEWQWKEGKDTEGNIVYRIKLPNINVFVDGTYTPGLGDSQYLFFKIENNKYNNIIDYSIKNPETFVRKFWNQIGGSSLGKYYTYQVKDVGPQYGRVQNYIQTKKTY